MINKFFWKLNVENNREDIKSDNITDNQGQYIKFTFDNNGITDTIAYLVYFFIVFVQ